MGVDAAVGRRFGRHTLVFRAGFEGRWGGDRKGESVWAAPSDYYNRTYSGAFRYAYRARSVDMEFGLDYYRDDVAGRDAANYSFPTLTCVSIWAAAVSYLMSSWTEP